jgi:hypothetical protein
VSFSERARRLNCLASFSQNAVFLAPFGVQSVLFGAQKARNLQHLKQ